MLVECLLRLIEEYEETGLVQPGKNTLETLRDKDLSCYYRRCHLYVFCMR